MHICNNHARYRPLGIFLSVRLIFDKTVNWLREWPGNSQARGGRKVRCDRRYQSFSSGLSERGMQGDEMLPENTHFHSSLLTTASFGVADNSATYL